MAGGTDLAGSYIPSRHIGLRLSHQELMVMLGLGYAPCRQAVCYLKTIYARSQHTGSYVLEAQRSMMNGEGLGV